MAQMYVYSYEQLVAIVNQQAVTIAQHAAMINNLQSERQWLEEDNDIQREELEKSQKNLKDLETSRNLTENTLKKELARLKESQYDIKWRHRNAVRELSGEKKRNLKLKAQCTSLLEKLDQSTQELQQKEQELDRANQELDLGYSVGEWMYQHLRYYYWGYFELLKYFQWPGPSSGGATIRELDTNDRPMEGKTVAVLPHSYNVTQGVLVSPKPPNSDRARSVLDGANKITAAVNMFKKTDFLTSLIAQSVIELVPSTIVCPKTVLVIRLAPSQDQSPIEFLSQLINNTSSCRSIPEVPEVAQLSALYSEVPATPSNHLQQLAICAPEWVNAPTKIPTLVAVIGAGRAPRVQKKKKRSNTTKLTYIPSCNKTFKSSPLKMKEKHERGNDEPKVGHCQTTTASSKPDRLSLANNRQSVDSCDGEKEVSTRKEQRRRTGEKKPKTLVSLLKNYRYSAKLNWPKTVSVDQLIKILGV